MVGSLGAYFVFLLGGALPAAFPLHFVDKVAYGVCGNDHLRDNGFLFRMVGSFGADFVFLIGRGCAAASAAAFTAHLIDKVVNGTVSMSIRFICGKNRSGDKICLLHN